VGNVKTNALRILDQKKIEYEMFQYDNRDGKIDGMSVAEKIGQDYRLVFKTLVTSSGSGAIYVFVIPVDSELDLKKAAKVSGEKKIEMLPMKDIQKWTGYIRGGCSPVGMKKQYRTYIDESAKNQEKIIVSAGKIGMQMKLKINDLLTAVDGNLAEVIHR
jgi:Cys-tRNA(Pro)/Cys-tRNA(Cys) deacylase